MADLEVLKGHNPVIIENKVLDSVKGSKFVLAVVTATKPDFYKQWPLIPAAEKLGVPAIIIYTGQHYDELLGHGMKELGLEKKVAFNLQIRGGLWQKGYELMAKMGAVGKWLKTQYPETKFVPIVHGDTLAAGIAPIGWNFATGDMAIQNEAGLRGMAPKNMNFTDFDKMIEAQWTGDWCISRQEPFPEQWDTFVCGASAGIGFPPLEINKQHLIREGCPDDKLFVVGNGVVDAVEMKKNEKRDKSVFDIYPNLEKYDNWVRTDIHRRANLSERRFSSVINGIELLVKSGQPVVMIELPATKFALEQHGLMKKIKRLDKEHDNFMYTDLWQKYSHVIEFLVSGRCKAVLTDSGSMQEELNHLGVPSLTVRFNTDRPETVFDAHSNLLVPPFSAEFVDGFVKHILSDNDTVKTMKNAPKLYGKNVSEKIIKILQELWDKDKLKTMRTVPDVLGIFEDQEIKFL
ncbi:MAG: UDP-N-acetyl glucosamine 2-epimerase [Candidatus Altiarchaeota archaeon]|nr:UDP-N-acetyl glucosamine 2-epimerase [Candidatus Altiarchaeota archaeon]